MNSGAIAYLLITHGSRDPRPQQAVQALAQALAPLPVGTAVLELGEAPLHQQILAFVAQAQLGSGDTLKLLPLFLLPGVHVMEDIPAEVAMARQRIAGLLPQELKLACPLELKLEILPFLGENLEAMAQLLRQSQRRLARQASHKQRPPEPLSGPWQWLLVAHGSRRPGSHHPLATLARSLPAPVAYWAQSPNLAEQMDGLWRSRPNKSSSLPRPIPVGILPYFLFPGGITDALADQILALAPQYPQFSLVLGDPLGTQPGFVDLVAQRLRPAPPRIAIAESANQSCPPGQC